MIHSLIRYVGGKSKSINSIMKYMPEHITEYREPMIGGGSVLLGLLENRRRPDKIVIGDLDYDISNLWRSVIESPDELQVQTKEIIDSIINREDDREIDYILETVCTTGVETASRVYVKNLCTKFGNYGGYLDSSTIDSKLRKFADNKYKNLIYSNSNLLRGVEVLNDDYKWALREPGDDVLVFLDPPYFNVQAKEGYYREHNEFNFEELRQELINTKHKFIMTIDISQFSESLKSHFNVYRYSIFYSMSCTYKVEYIVTNF